MKETGEILVKFEEKKSNWMRARLGGVEKARKFVFNHPNFYQITIDEFDVCEKYWKLVVLEEIKKILTKRVIIKEIRKVYQKFINTASQKIEELSKENENQRAVGIAYTKREKLIDMVDFYSNIREEFKQIDIIPLPIEEVITPDDVDYIKKNGVKDFIKFNYIRLCKIRKKKMDLWYENLTSTSS